MINDLKGDAVNSAMKLGNQIKVWEKKFRK